MLAARSPLGADLAASDGKSPAWVLAASNAPLMIFSALAEG